MFDRNAILNNDYFEEVVLRLENIHVQKNYFSFHCSINMKVLVPAANVTHFIQQKERMIKMLERTLSNTNCLKYFRLNDQISEICKYSLSSLHDLQIIALKVVSIDSLKFEFNNKKLGSKLS